MQKCSKCGAENKDEAKYCSECGADLVTSSITTSNVNSNSSEKTGDDGKPWPTFAKLGKTFGIISLALCWIPYSMFYLGGIGIVFSCLGKWSKSNREQAEKGFNMSLISVILNFVLSIVGIGVLAFLSAKNDW